MMANGGTSYQQRRSEARDYTAESKMNDIGSNFIRNHRNRKMSLPASFIDTVRNAFSISAATAIGLDLYEDINGIVE